MPSIQRHFEIGRERDWNHKIPGDLHVTIVQRSSTIGGVGVPDHLDAAQARLEPGKRHETDQPPHAEVGALGGHEVGHRYRRPLDTHTPQLAQAVDRFRRLVGAAAQLVQHEVVAQRLVRQKQANEAAALVETVDPGQARKRSSELGMSS